MAIETIKPDNISEAEGVFEYFLGCDVILQSLYVSNNLLVLNTCAKQAVFDTYLGESTKGVYLELDPENLTQIVLVPEVLATPPGAFNGFMIYPDQGAPSSTFGRVSFCLPANYTITQPPNGLDGKSWRVDDVSSYNAPGSGRLVIPCTWSIT